MHSAQRFELDESRDFLGAGRFADVYRAFDRVQRREVALKCLRSSDPELLLRLRAEFGRISKLRGILHASPNLVGYHRLFVPTAEPGEGIERPLLSMQLVPGVRLDRWLERLPDEEARVIELERILPQLLAGLDLLHGSGLIHRDLSPGNILVDTSDETPRPVLVDYGLSIRSSRTEVPQELVHGTYRPPEVRASAHPLVEPSADVWTLGMTFTDTLLGRPRVPGMPARERILSARLPTRWKDRLLAMLAESPSERPTVSELQQGHGGTSPHVRSSSTGRWLASDWDAPRRRLVRAMLGKSLESEVALVVGPAGIGKSALVERALAELEGVDVDARPLVLRADCEEGLIQGYNAIQAIADALLVPLLGPLRSELEPLPGIRELVRAASGLALVHGLFERKAVVASDPDRAAREAFRALFLRLQSKRRVVLVVDDAHRGDGDSARMLAALLEPPMRALSLVIVGRSSASPPPLHELADMVLHACRIELEPDGELAPLAPTLPPDPLCGPLLRVASIAHAPLEAGELASAAGLPIDDLTTRRAFELEDRGVLESSGHGERLYLPSGAVRWRFRSALGERERVELHGVIADLLLRRSTVEPMPVFRHLAAAGRHDEALAWGRRAADAAAEALAFRVEAQLRAELMELPGGESDWQRAEARAHALVRAGATLESSRWFERTAELAERAGQAIETCEALLRLAGRQMMFAGEFRLGKALFLRAATQLGLRPPTSALRAIVEALWRRLAIMIADRMGRGIELGSRRDPEPLRVQALWDVAMATAMIDYPTSDALAMRHLSAVRGSSLRSDWLRAFSREAASCANIGGAWLHRRAAKMLAACERLGEGTDDPLDAAWVLFARRSVAWFRGDWSAAAAAAREAERVLRLRCVGVAWDLAHNDVFLLSALAMSGCITELRGRMELSLRDAQARTDRYTGTSLRLGEPLVGYATDTCAEVLSQAREHLQGWPLHETPSLLFPWIQMLVGCRLYLGEAEATREEFGVLWRWVRRAGLTHLECVGAILLHARGRLCIACGELRSARRIAAKLRRSGLAMARALGMALGAGVDAGREPARAREGFLAAAVALERCEMRVYAAACRFRAAGLGGRQDEGLRELGFPRPERVAAAVVPSCGGLGAG